MGYDLGVWGHDGDFGDMTEMAVRDYQQTYGLEVDGIVGEKTVAALLAPGKDISSEKPTQVRIDGGNCYARAEPHTDSKILGTCYRGTFRPYAGKMSENGWLSIDYNGMNAWVSGKYAKLLN
jgi:peptidoglycan hydrolase-like protein with peptidoglycan-binding domain